MDKPLHYEIHVTVKTDEVSKFIEECGAIGVKPIVLDLQKLDGSGAIQDVMTSSKVAGNDIDAFNEMTKVSESLQLKGFNVVRKKLETAPWHPKALVHDENSETGYFEAHIPILSHPEYLEQLRNIGKAYGLHMSRNPFKVREDGRVHQMMTLRGSTSFNVFDEKLFWALSEITRAGFYIMKKVEVEYALYDSNVQHDSAWISQ